MYHFESLYHFQERNILPKMSVICTNKQSFPNSGLWSANANSLTVAVSSAVPPADGHAVASAKAVSPSETAQQVAGNALLALEFQRNLLQLRYILDSWEREFQNLDSNVWYMFHGSLPTSWSATCTSWPFLAASLACGIADPPGGAAAMQTRAMQSTVIGFIVERFHRIRLNIWKR